VFPRRIVVNSIKFNVSVAQPQRGFLRAEECPRKDDAYGLTRNRQRSHQEIGTDMSACRQLSGKLPQTAFMRTDPASYLDRLSDSERANQSLGGEAPLTLSPSLTWRFDKNMEDVTPRHGQVDQNNHGNGNDRGHERRIDVA
jgi:hypothetical protein